MNIHKACRLRNAAKRSATCLFPFVIVSACAVGAWPVEIRLAIPLLAGVTAVMTIALACTLYYGERSAMAWSPAFILTVALVFRLMFLFAPPQLSDDIYRYQWDGANVLQGVNPYATAPSAVKPPPALADIHSRINHPEYVTIYPPAAQLVFAGGALTGNHVIGMKSFLVLVDLILCGLLILLLKKLLMPLWLAVLYAWNPLPVLEIAGSGHVDGAGFTLLIGSACLLFSGRQNDAAGKLKHWPFLFAGILLAGACLVKLFPFVLTPVWFLLVPAGRRRYFVTGFIAALAALALPFLPQLVNITGSLGAYARNWEFAGFAFNILRSITGSGTIARLFLSGCFLVLVCVIVFRLAVKIRCTPSIPDKGRLALKSAYAMAMAFLLLTPTLHPWYALSLAVFLPFCPGPAGLVLCWAVFLTYQVQIPYFLLGKWMENPQVTAAVFLAPVTAYLLSKVPGGIRQFLKGR